MSLEREHKLFIGQLPRTVTEEELHDMFSQYGELRGVHIMKTFEGSSKMCAFVKFSDRDAALVVIELMNGLIPAVSRKSFSILYLFQSPMLIY